MIQDFIAARMVELVMTTEAIQCAKLQTTLATLAPGASDSALMLTLCTLQMLVLLLLLLYSATTNIPTSNFLQDRTQCHSTEGRTCRQWEKNMHHL